MDTKSNLALNPEDYVYKEMVLPLFGLNLLESLKAFREQSLFCDFQIKIEHETFHVHRVIMAGCSDYFRALFSHDTKDRNISSLELEEVTLVGIRPLIDFAYSGLMNLNLENVADVLAAATFLQISGAITLCSNFLQTRMTFDNADQIVSLGCSLGLTELKDCRTKMVLENFFTYAERIQFLELDADTLAGYLISDALNTTTEGRLLKLALKWYNHDPSNRLKDAFKVFEKIRFTLDGWPTIEYAKGVEPFISNKDCSNLLGWCQEYMRNASKKHLINSHRTRVRFPQKTLVILGGIRVHHSYFIDEFDGEINSHGEQNGCGKNFYFHRKFEKWFPLGVVGNTESRSHCSFVEVNGYGITCGGYTYTQDFEESRKLFTRDVSLFTPGGFAMWELVQLQEERAHHVTLHIPGFLYAIGGQNDQGPIKSVECFDLEKKWAFVCPLNVPLYDHAGATHNGKLYITGGVELGVVSDKLLTYHPENDTWQELAPMHVSRRSHGMALLGTSLIVCGGRSTMEGLRCLSSVEMYSLEMNQWTHVTPMRFDCCDMGCVVLNDGTLIVAGGENSVGDLIDIMQQYDPKCKGWWKFGRLPYPVKNFGCCALTIKETADGHEDTDSLAEAFDEEHAYLYSDSDGSNDLENYAGDGVPV